MALNWTPELDRLIGTSADRKLAEQLGVSVDTVKHRKYKLGIASYRYKSPKIVFTSEMDALLGTAPDEAIAERLDISRFPVISRRKILDIPSYRAQNRVIPKDVSAYSKEAHNIYARRRRHKKLDLEDTLTCEQWKYACEYFSNKCVYCHKEAFLTEDHLVPVNEGGPRTALNILPACWTCNHSKNAQRAHIWIYERFGMKEGKKIIDRIVAYLVEVQEND